MSTRTQLISKEMHEMGEFILLTAQSTAESRDVRAERVVRHGNVAAEVIGLSREVGADYVVLGRPRLEHEENVFSTDHLKDFSQRIENESGAEVVVVEVSVNETP
jgi:nucleotide-binding universal stress UspA family protein